MKLHEIREGILKDVHVITVGPIDFFIAKHDLASSNTPAHAIARAKERSADYLTDGTTDEAKRWYAAAAQGLKQKAKQDPVEQPYLIFNTALNQGAIVWYSSKTGNARITTILPPGAKQARTGTTIIEV